MPTSHLSNNDCSLDFWERGPVRQILETEFEMAMIQEIHERDIRLDWQEEKRIHDIVVPRVFLQLMDSCAISKIEAEACSCHLKNQHLIQHEMSRLIGIEMDACEQNGLPAMQSPLRPLALVFHSLPEVLKKFFSP